jgi:hypothetical protein
MSARRVGIVFLAATVVLLLTSACTVKEPDAGEWRDLARQTLDDIASEVATAELTLAQLDRGKLPAAYGETVLAESEEAASIAEESLSSVQPPPGLGARADQVLGLIGRAIDAVQATREAVVAGRFHDPELLHKLDRLHKALDERRANL